MKRHRGIIPLPGPVQVKPQPETTVRVMPRTGMVGLNPQPEPPSIWRGEMTARQFVDLYGQALKDIEAQSSVKLKVDVRADRPLTPEQKRRLEAALRRLGLEP